MQETMSTHSTEAATASDVRRLRWWVRTLVGVSIVLALVVVGLAAWTAFGGESDKALSAEQEQMVETVDAYIAAWNAGDGDAAEALMDPKGYLEDVGGRWHVADGQHTAYLETLHATGFPIFRSDDVSVVGSVVLVSHTYAEGSSSESPNVYYLSPDGTQIRWVLEPYPLK
ncbi:MAG: nuclear transport factor 2 family protein [Acidimicrobiia bacterium]